MRNRRVVAAVVSAVMASMPIVAVATPATADPLPTGYADIGVTYPSTTTFKVCPVGLTDGTGEWVFEVDGLRSDGTQIHSEQGGFGASFATCVYISTNGSSAGTFFATLSFARIGQPIDANGVQTSTIPEFVALAGEEGDWTPAQDSNGFGT
jgi:hypothetical protein